MKSKKDLEEITQSSSISNAPASHHVPNGKPDNKRKVSLIISKINGKKDEQ